jgi:hypothetical protein
VFWLVYFWQIFRSTSTQRQHSNELVLLQMKVIPSAVNSQRNQRNLVQVQYRKEVKNYVFVLKGCRRLDTTIKCDLIVTNRKAERNLSIYATLSYMVDSSGISYQASTVSIGGRTASSLQPLVAPGIDYTADITFENIPEGITRVPLLKLFLDGEVQFRNISFLN